MFTSAKYYVNEHLNISKAILKALRLLNSWKCVKLIQTNSESKR